MPRPRRAAHDGLADVEIGEVARQHFQHLTRLCGVAALVLQALDARAQLGDAVLGVGNAFGDRLRLYPLAADLGKTAPQDAGGRDVRYPRVTLDEVAARKPELLVLPDEPHAFSAEDEAALCAALPGVRVLRISGRDVFWYGAWTIDAIDRLAAQLAA